MKFGLGHWCTTAAVAAALIYGAYYAVLIPATVQAAGRYTNSRNCGAEQSEWIKTDGTAYGDNHARAVGLARLTIVCAGIPKMIESAEKNVSSQVVEMAHQADIHAEALVQVKKAYP